MKSEISYYGIANLAIQQDYITIMPNAFLNVRKVEQLPF